MPIIANMALAEGKKVGTVLSNTGSLESLELLNNWVKSCQQHHGECIRTLEGEILGSELKLPTRVLDTSSAHNGFVRLVETHNSPRGQWTALSHCWGNIKPICTTRDNLQAHRQGIPISHLPSTYRDAVTVTRSLDLNYLWIDTLCIIQQDVEDWEREAPKMGEVYEHAKIVIAATGSSNAYEGCFVDTPTSVSVELPYASNGIRTGQPFTMKFWTPTWQVKNVFRPLSDRAWTIQERVLSRRIVHYTAKGIWWNCRHFGAICIRHDGISFKDDQLIARQQSWTGFLEQYLNCALTVSTDNLQAVAGLANRIARYRSDDYYHGCWINELPEQLIWYGKAPRPSELKDRPSWSWSSTAIGKRIFLDDRASKCLTNLCGPFKPYLLNGLLVRCFVQTAVRLAKPIETTNLKAELRILIGNVQDQIPEQVQFQKQLVIIPKEEENKIPDDHLYLILNNKNHAVGVAVMDDVSWFSQKIDTNSNMSLILLAGAPNWRWRSRWMIPVDQKDLYYCLVTLTTRDGQNAHCRIGFAVIYSRVYAEQAIRQEIVLV